MTCPNCGGPNYVNAPLVEVCDDCGIQCLYHGAGPNGAYQDMMDRKEAELREAERKESESQEARDEA